MNPLVLSRCAAANPLGLGCGATLAALRDQRSGLRPNDFETARLDTWIGRVNGLETEPVTGRLAEFDCRNNRLAQLGLRQDGFEAAVGAARERYGSHRIAVLIGTSTSGIHETELAYRGRDPATGALPRGYCYRRSQNVYSVAEFVRCYLRLAGPAAAISTACSSSAKVFASAHRLLEAGFADAAVVGGVDSLCLTTLYGFGSLELLSREPCRPCDAERDGISIGEAAGFVLLERPDRASGAVSFLGYGESSDGYHMSAPHPEGAGVHQAMSDALARADLAPREIDYINLHGTATPANDRAEDAAIHRIFGEATACSSTKGWTGHTLGAAGITEAIISALCLEHAYLPGSLNTRNLDPALKSRVLLSAEERPLRYVLSNSFGFGGNNCSLVFGGGGAMTETYLGSVGVIGQGIPDWRALCAILRGERAYEPGPQPQPDAAVLPANERRRAAASVRWALAAAGEAMGAAGCNPGDVATVFATSGSDGETLHRICEALAGAERDISPTRFHNSVHNAAAGYWTIAAGSRKPSVSLCGYDGSFGVGLVEAVSQVRAEGAPVLLVVYDLPYPEPLNTMRPFSHPLAVALLLAPEPLPGTLACLRVEIAPEAAACTPFPAALPAEFERTPTGRSLPLLASVARGGCDPVRLYYLDDCQLVVGSATWS